MSLFAFTALTALAGAVLSMIVGVIWYGPLFGKQWAEVIGSKMPSGLSKAEMMAMQKAMIPTYLTNFVVSFAQYYALGFVAALLVITVGGLTVLGALMYGVFIWLGFIVPVLTVGALWSGKSKRHSWMMFGLTAGYQLVVVLLSTLAWLLMSKYIG